MPNPFATPELALTGLATLISVLAVGLPFLRGLRLCRRARRATRRLAQDELRSGAAAARRGVEPVAALMLRVMRRSRKQAPQESYPVEFLIDASRQYAVNEFDNHYTRPISMYANLLPPIGFIGTTGGLLVLFLSMHLADRSLELGALAIALLSSVFALLGFALLEGLKIRLYGRLLVCLADVVALGTRDPRPQPQS